MPPSGRKRGGGGAGRSGSGAGQRAPVSVRQLLGQDAMSFEDIIENVKAHPELWFSGHSMYRHRYYQKNVWQSIARKLNLDESVVKKKWKNLKDQYRKELKKNSDSENIVWRFYKSMDFLKEELMPSGNSKEEHSEEEVDQQSSTDSFDVKMQPPPSKRKKLQVEEEEVKSKKSSPMLKRINKLMCLVDKHVQACDTDARKDPDYMFLMSILPSIKKLTDIQKLHFRGRINDWLLETMTQNEYSTEFTSECDSKFFVASEFAEAAKTD